MEKRILFPAVMFLFAGASFAFGGWQYLQARAARQASQQRTAFMMTTIEESGVSRTQKQQLYASIMSGFPAAPSVLGVDFSGSFASPIGGDACTTEGQRTICRALIAQGASSDVQAAVCGVCRPSGE
ncbi:MAG: hypothetical protein IT405_03465 [Candidatus Yanofskybacteria bacterium]|nr:hypothetical protein [Candidatus Yanofskybacteria bacterium]